MPRWWLIRNHIKTGDPNVYRLAQADASELKTALACIVGFTFFQNLVAVIFFTLISYAVSLELNFLFGHALYAED